MYNKRIWLNKKKSPSTGSVAAFSGNIEYRNRKRGNYSYLEIADCTGKIRLEEVYDDNQEDFLIKMRLLHKVIGKFIVFLESNPERSK